MTTTQPRMYLVSTPQQLHALDEAGQAADINAVINAARTVHVDNNDLTVSDKWNVTRILGRDAHAVLAHVGDQLQQVARFENEAADGTAGDYDPDERAAAFRKSARAVAAAAVTG